MKKSLKIIIGIIVIIAILLILDIASIFIFKRPIFAVQARQPYTYTGLFYNTYYCPEYYTPQIKIKGTKFGCATSTTNIGKVKEIVDTTKDIKDFACAEALEQFYEDEKYLYYYSCLKSKYIIVKYENGYQETVENALKYGTIKITDLDTYNIDYIKYER